MHMPQIHPKWLERYVRHMEEALRGAERGDAQWACYNAYVAVRALLMGLLGYHPYAPLPLLAALPTLVKKVASNSAREVLECAYCLERRLHDPDAVKCVKCADVISQALFPASTQWAK